MSLMEMAAKKRRTRRFFLRYHPFPASLIKLSCGEYYGLMRSLCYTKTLTYSVRNLTRGTVVGGAIGCAESSAERRTGLLKHTKLDEGEGLWIVPCEAVHTFFMKFALDLIYLDRRKRVRGVRRAVAPWRFSMCFAAHSVIELPVGTIERTRTQNGDELEIVSLTSATWCVLKDAFF